MIMNYKYENIQTGTLNFNSGIKVELYETANTEIQIQTENHKKYDKI